MGNQGVSSLRSRGCAANEGKKQGVPNTDGRQKYAANHRMNDMFCRIQNKPKPPCCSFLLFVENEKNQNEP
jgi:hypothetical protein